MNEIDQYIVLSTVSEQLGALRATDVLEDAGIPVMVEHILASRTQSKQKRFKVMVPDRYSQKANQLIAPLLLK